jgi:DNA polymerase III epsilon subunit family exonuclease
VARVQLSFDAADRLVELVEARRGPVPATEAARTLFALASAPTAIARSLLDDVVHGDARLSWRGESVGLSDPPGARTLLETASFVVFDLETTGLSASTSRIVEIGAQRVDRLELTSRFETLVNPGAPLPTAITALTGIAQRDVLGAPAADLALRRFLDFTGDAVLVAHNARFDMAFLDRAVLRLTGRRVAAPVVDTVWLARRLLAGRTSRFGLARLAQFFGTAAEPCHRALPDAAATAEILLALIGLAQERGAETVADLVELSAPRARRLHAKRSLVSGAPRGPGVYLFRDTHRQVLYVGRARDLSARLRSYFSGERQRPAVEAALGALAQVEWRCCGSELEAALDELRLLRELRPPANARGTRPDRHVYLRRRGAGWACGTEATPFGPLAGRSLARRAVQALQGFEGDDPRAALPPLRLRLQRLARDLRFEDAARLRDRIGALEQVAERLDELDRLRRMRACLVVPALEPGMVRAIFVAGAVVARRTVPRGGGARLEVEAGLDEARRVGLPPQGPEVADELLLIGSFVRRPSPELRILPLRREAILAAVEGLPLAA